MNEHKRWKVRVLTRTMERVFTRSGTKKEVINYLVNNYPSNAAVSIS